jgi:protein-S-isoprenylcysteine O-methyltransferase Ste14
MRDVNRPPLWAVLGTVVSAPLFIGAVIVYVPYALSGWRLAPPFFGWEPSRAIGAALMVASGVLLSDFIVRFVREGHGTPVPMAPPRRLVVRGPYRYVRNPAYLGAVGAVVGQGIWLGSASVLVYAAVLAVVFHAFVVGYEEPHLERTFGDAYETYRREVPRWLPRGRR